LRWVAGQMVDFGVKIKLVGDSLQLGEDINEGFAKPIWHDLLSGIEDLGYSGTSPSVSALHYDWRMSLDQLMTDGTFAKFKSSIEAAVAKSGGKRAILVTLSYGGALMHKFLATFVDAAWKSTYVERWISLSGVFGGSAELSRMAFYPEAEDFFNIPSILPYISLEIARGMSNTFPSSFVLQPHFLSDQEVLVSALVDGVQKTYTSSGLSQALADSGLSEATQVYEFAKNSYSFHYLPAPGVAVDCVYGIGDNTIGSITYGDGFNKPATAYRYEDGDGVAPTRSLSLCAQWKAAPATAAARKLTQTQDVSVHTFPGIGHGGTLHDAKAIQAISDIVRSLNGFQAVSPCAPSAPPNPCAAPSVPSSTAVANPCILGTTPAPNPCIAVAKFANEVTSEVRSWGDALGPFGPGSVQLALGASLFALLVALALVVAKRRSRYSCDDSYSHMRSGAASEFGAEECELE